MMARRGAIAVILSAALFALSVLASGAARAQAPESPNIRIGLIGIADNIPVYIADKLGYFKDEGLNASITVFPGGAQAQPALIAGKIDFLHTNIVSLLLARGQGYDISIVSNNSVSRPAPPDAGQMIVKADSPIRSVKDLEGKRVAVNAINNIIWLAARAMIEKHGGDPRKVTFQEVPFPNMLDTLLNDRVDAIISVEPFSTISGGTGKTRVLGYYYYEVQPSLELAGMVALDSWIGKNPVTTQKFVRAFGRGIQHMTSSPAVTRQSLIEYSKMNPALAEKVLLNVLTTRSNPKSIQVWEDLMLKHGLLKQKVGVEKIIYKTALE